MVRAAWFCPQCADLPGLAAAPEDELLPVACFHVVFILPEIAANKGSSRHATYDGY